MKNIYRILSCIIALLIICGCSSKKSEQKPTYLSAVTSEFEFGEKYSKAYCQIDEKQVNLINLNNDSVFSLLGALKPEKAVSCNKSDKEGEKPIDIEFSTFDAKGGTYKSLTLSIFESENVILENGKTQAYYKARKGTYKNISRILNDALAENEKYFKQTESEGKAVVSFIKDGKETENPLTLSGKNAKVFLYRENTLLIEDVGKSNTVCCFYDSVSSAVSPYVSYPCDCLNGYICFAEGNTVVLKNISDTAFSYKLESFEKELYNAENPFVYVRFTDINNLSICYKTEDGSLYTQNADVSAFYTDYENKKAEAEKLKKEAEAKKPKKPATPKPSAPPANYTYDPPIINNAGGIPPFTAEMDARILSYANVRAGYGWKGSENRQSYYSQFNAYATGDRSKNTVYLTFDEGYEYNENTSKILDILKAKGVKAVFFITGSYAKSRPDLVRRMIAEGHTVGNHSMNHKNFTEISTRQCYDEIKNLHDYVQANFGYSMHLFRFPEGVASDRALQLVKEMGYCSVFWNCAYADWDPAKQPSADTTRQLIANNTQNGTIYLLHATSNTNVAMLGEIIDTVRASGYNFGLFGS